MAELSPNSGFLLSILLFVQVLAAALVFVVLMYDVDGGGWC